MPVRFRAATSNRRQMGDRGLLAIQPRAFDSLAVAKLREYLACLRIYEEGQLMVRVPISGNSLILRQRGPARMAMSPNRQALSRDQPHWLVRHRGCRIGDKYLQRRNTAGA